MYSVLFVWSGIQMDKLSSEYLSENQPLIGIS